MASYPGVLTFSAPRTYLGTVPQTITTGGGLTAADISSLSIPDTTTVEVHIGSTTTDLDLGSGGFNNVPQIGKESRWVFTMRADSVSDLRFTAGTNARLVLTVFRVAS